MKRIQIADFVKWELDKLRKECNFSPDEEMYFNLRAIHKTNEQISEIMNYSMSKIDSLSRKVKQKIIKVL